MRPSVLSPPGSAALCARSAIVARTSGARLPIAVREVAATKIVGVRAKKSQAFPAIDLGPAVRRHNLRPQNWAARSDAPEQHRARVGETAQSVWRPQTRVVPSRVRCQAEPAASLGTKGPVAKTAA